MIFVLGILDILAGLSLLLVKFNIFPVITALFGLYVLIKALVFLRSFASIVDIIVVIIFIITLLGSFNILSLCALFWLIQKGFFSLF